MHACASGQVQACLHVLLELLQVGAILQEAWRDPAEAASWQAGRMGHLYVQARGLAFTHQADA